jgi:hypothetical protein
MQTFFLKDTVRVHLSNEIGRKIKKNDKIALVLSIGGALVHVMAVSCIKCISLPNIDNHNRIFLTNLMFIFSLKNVVEQSVSNSDGRTSL